MPTWNSHQYLKFTKERTQPAVDLVARLNLESPTRIIDLGCGPGNSTSILAKRWPNAEVTGLDSSPEMLMAARNNAPQVRWIQSDIGSWSADLPYDLIFSNAALQWVPDHGQLIPHLFSQVNQGGVFAMQIPANFSAAPHRLMREIATSKAWAEKFTTTPREWHHESPGFYYDCLCALTPHLEIWETEYIHILEGVSGIVEWYRGTGLRPWLDALNQEADQKAFLKDYLDALTPHYPAQKDGGRLFPFRRLFLIAYKT